MHLLGCATGATPLADVLSGVVAEKFASGSDLNIAAKLNPLYRYLRVDVAGRPSALLVLGYIDAHPQGEIEVWYSAKHEVIKTQYGRIVSTSGLELDWRRVDFPVAPPDWASVPRDGARYSRTRDVMPGHHDGIRDHIQVNAWLGPPPVATLTGAQWFREDMLSTTAQPLPPAWYAMGRHSGQPAVVYSEQCLSATFCLKLQHWPVQESAP
ncbi:YjbF family lipoprotein [Rhodoferax sp.]|uniref:YjbF family lipoprotein n=1 Tax=Rhodoferax sp. TaxID=50421 RepID=UPI00301A36AC